MPNTIPFQTSGTKSSAKSMNQIVPFSQNLAYKFLTSLSCALGTAQTHAWFGGALTSQRRIDLSIEQEARREFSVGDLI